MCATIERSQDALTLAAFQLKIGVAPKMLVDGRVAFIYPMMFTAALCVGRLDDDGCYDDRWCYHDMESALDALSTWDGTGEPQGWHRHPATGRRRTNGDAATEYVNR